MRALKGVSKLDVRIQSIDMINAGCIMKGVSKMDVPDKFIHMVGVGSMVKRKM